MKKMNKYLQKIILMILCLSIVPSYAHAMSYIQMLCHSPGIECIRVKPGQTWHSLWPDEAERSIIMKINKRNTYLAPGTLVAVPTNLSDPLSQLSPFPLQIAAPGEKELIFDPRKHAWAAYSEDGQLVRWGPASGGKKYCPDTGERCTTAVGQFRIFSKGDADCISHVFPLPDGGAPMPYCMFFNTGMAFHGGPHEVPGYNASHGCVRVFVDDARWLSEEFVEIGTKVIIKPY